MFTFHDRVKSLEEFNDMELTLDEKLEIAFEMNDKKEFIRLLKAGANPKGVIDKARTTSCYRLSFTQYSMLAETNKHK